MRKGISAVSLLAAGALALTACGSGDDGGTTTASAGGGAVSIDFSFEWTCEGNWPIMYIADEKGYLAEENLEVNYVRGQGGSATVPLVGAGEQDMGALSAPAVVLGAGQGLPITVVGVAAVESPVVIVADESIKEPKDLEGKKLAVQLQQFEGAVWKSFVSATGIDESKIEVTNAGNDSSTLFLDHRVDAIVVFEPTPSVWALTEGREGGETIIRMQDYVPTYGHTIVANNDFLKKNPEAVRGMLRAWAKATKYAVEHPDEALELLERNCTELTPETAKFTTEKYIAAYSTEQSKENGYLWFDPSGLDQTKKVLVDAGLMEDVDLADHISTDYLPDPAIK